MNKLINNKNISVIILIFVIISSYSHPPYDISQGYYKATEGKEYKLVKSYVDGILFTDPVKLLIKDIDENTVNETEFCRNICILKWVVKSPVIFGYKHSLSLIPEKIWRINNEGLITSNNKIYKFIGIFYPLFDQFIWYLLSLILFLLPFLFLYRIWKRNRKFKRAILMVSLGAISALYLLIWIYAIILLSYQSIWILLILIYFTIPIINYIRAMRKPLSVCNDSTVKESNDLSDITAI